MNTLADFPVTRRWPPRRNDVLQLYSVPSPNGVKVSIMLEETGLGYDAHRVDLAAGAHRSAEFMSLNPNAKIPAILDPHGPDGQPVGVFESNAILLYLAEKTGQCLPTDPRQRLEAMQWLCFQTAAIGPMFGQLGYYWKFAGRELADKRPLERYRNESRRLLEVLEDRLRTRDWMAGTRYSIVDIATFALVNNLVTYYEARELVGFDDLGAVREWHERCRSRPAVARGLVVPARPTSPADGDQDPARADRNVARDTA